jgi:hypothetical protein
VLLDWRAAYWELDDGQQDLPREWQLLVLSAGESMANGQEKKLMTLWKALASVGGRWKVPLNISTQFEVASDFFR